MAPTSTIEFLNAVEIDCPGVAAFINGLPTAKALFEQSLSIPKHPPSYGGKGQDLDGWYTVGTVIYSDKTDRNNKPKERAVTYMLFELQNALREDQYQDLKKTSMEPKEYARAMVALELEGGIEVGNMWNRIIKSGVSCNDTKVTYYRSLYLDSLKVGQSEMINEILATTYPDGQTRQDYYIKQYNTVVAKNLAKAVSIV